MKSFFLIGLLLTLPLCAKELTLVSKDGKIITAELVDVSKKLQITLKLANKKRITVTPDALAEESLVTISREWIAVRSAMVDPINNALGHKLFGPTGDIFTEDVEKVAARVRWPQESKTPFTSSYRRYTGESYRFAGARPYSVVAYGDVNGKTEQVSLIFANKGDTLSTSGFGEDHFTESGEKISVKSFTDAMRRDEETISRKLTQLFGEATKQRFGEGKDRRSVHRWDWNSHSFLLTALEGEYVGLQIVPPAFADDKGSTDRIGDKEMKERLLGNVVREKNGDVYIKNIPMVDQGPKGYCAPATFERAMRYAGVPADMYLLATLATQAGGGTHSALLFDEVKRSVSRKGRRSRALSVDDLEFKKLKKYIDKGVPVMWQMCAISKYQTIANTRSKERKSVTDWAAYTEKIAAEAAVNESELSIRDDHHICMIIGYNEATGEIAVSDSWGPRYTIRWVHHKEAQAVTSNGGFAIDL